MASFSESAAYFDTRATEMGIPAGLLNAIKHAGITTLGRLAFAVNRPGQEFDEARFDNWLQNVNGGVAPTMGATAAVRRLHFEAEIVLTATLKSQVEGTDRDAAGPKPLPFAERISRMETLQRRLPGLNLQGPNEPSQALVDECVHQYEVRVLRRIEPAKCNSRETEAMTTKRDKKLRIDTTSLSIKETRHMPEEDVSTVFKLQQCLRRRAVAYDLAGLISFSRSEEYIDHLLRRLTVDPPPGYAATSINQVLRADREVFVKMSQTVRDIRPPPLMPRPLDDALMNTLRDYEVAFHLVPLPVAAARAASSNYGPTRSNHEQDQQDAKPYKGHGKARGKGKKGGSNVAPKGFSGCVGRDNRNRPICFNWNLNKCSKAAAGGTCDRGRHVCFKAGCFKLHKYCEDHKTEMPAQNE